MKRSNPVPERKEAKKPKQPDWLLFFSKFLTQGIAISSLVPSSPFLARAFLRDIDFARCKCIVELGAGTGPITEELLRLAPPSCRCVILERDKDFCARLRERFPGIDLAEADALDLDRVLAERGIDKVDHFLCGLPLPSFPREPREKILEVARRRQAPGGDFRQLTHMPYVYYRMYRRYYDKVAFRFVFRNLPPGGYYVCRGPKERVAAAGRG